MVLKKMHLPKQELNILPLWIHPKMVTCKQAKKATILQQVLILMAARVFNFIYPLLGLFHLVIRD